MNRNTAYEPQFLIAELQRFVTENGYRPRTTDMTNYRGYPSMVAFISRFGSWSAALEVAGIKPNFNDRRHRNHATQVAGND